MIEKAVKEIKQRQQTIHEQIKSLQAEAGKLGKALSVLETLSDVAPEKAPAAKRTKQPKAPKAKKRTMSAAGRKAIGAAAKARWAKLRAKKEGKAAAPAPVKQRRLSAAGRKAIIAATKARWAKIRAAKAPQAPKAAHAERPQGKLPLMAVVLKVLQAEKAQSIPEIIVAVNKAGYASKSKTFATIIGQTLKKAGAQVVRVKRGLYALKG